MTSYSIPFNRPSEMGSEREYMAQALARGHISGDGPFTRACHALLERHLGASKVLLTTSCTHALEMSALLLEIRPGDEVILPSFTFVSTANAFVLRGAHPVFVDIRPDTLNIDETQLESRISVRTKAIVVVHYAGVGCEMGVILDIARRHGVPVVEDNAHGLFGRYKGKSLGSFGVLATQSFHETKNVTCGEGGALVINDSRLIERAEILREKGTDRSRFFRGEVDKYSWVDIGSSYLLSDLLAAFLLAQLEMQNEIQYRRKRIWESYQRGLCDWANQKGVQLPHVPEHCEQSYHLFYLVMPSAEDRQRFIAHLRDQGIHCVFHYVPLHLSEYGRSSGGAKGMCPVTEEVSRRLVRLPFFNDLSPVQQGTVVDAIRGF